MFKSQLEGGTSTEMKLEQDALCGVCITRIGVATRDHRLGDFEKNTDLGINSQTQCTRQ